MSCPKFLDHCGVHGDATQGQAPPQHVFERPVVARTAPPAEHPGFALQQQQLASHPGQPLDDTARNQLKPQAVTAVPLVKLIAPSATTKPLEQPVHNGNAEKKMPLLPAAATGAAAIAVPDRPAREPVQPVTPVPVFIAPDKHAEPVRNQADPHAHIPQAAVVPPAATAPPQRMPEDHAVMPPVARPATPPSAALPMQAAPAQSVQPRALIPEPPPAHRPPPLPELTEQPKGQPKIERSAPPKITPNIVPAVELKAEPKHQEAKKPEDKADEEKKKQEEQKREEEKRR